MALRNEPLEICFIGAHKADPPEGALMVSSDRDYVLACRAVRDTSSRLTGIWVTGRPFFTWLQAYCSLIDLDFRSRELTPRLILAEKWGVTIPDWLDDETVRGEDLLNLDIPPGTAEDFVDALLGHFLGKVFQASELDPERIVDVLAAVVDPKSRALFDRYPVLRRSLDEKCSRWAEGTVLPWGPEFCRSLKARTDALWHDLTLWSLLGRYPDKLIEFAAAPQRVFFLRDMPLGLLSELPLHQGAVEVALNQIAVFFNDIKGSVSSIADLQKVLNAVSGRLPQEFAFVEALLESSSYDLQTKDIELVRETFKTCPGISAVRIDSLDRFVPPARPSLPEPGQGWGADRWVTWSIEEYLPYRHWQVQNRQYDDQVEGAARAFSDWYVDEYTTLHQDAGRSLVHLLTQWRERLMDDQFSLILLVDCLPVSFWALFEEEMKNAGFYRHQHEYRFVPLPSHTEICKPLLLAGTWEKVDTEYQDLIQERAQRDWPGKQVHYVPNLKVLSEADIPDAPAILVLNFLQVDKILHTDVEADGSTHREEVFRLFARLVKAVKGIFERWQGHEDRFGVYVVTDHGATRILEEEKSSLDSKVVSRLFPDEKCRFAMITPDNASVIPENLWAFGYKFRQPFGNQEAIFFIPRGHNTVKTGARLASFVHGGASPEEVIVPAAMFRPVRAAWKEPAVRFVNLRTDRESGGAIFYVLRVVSIQLEIQNPNMEEIRVVRADIISPDADVKEFTTCTIGSLETGTLELSCHFRKSAQEQEELQLRITYELSGEEHTVQALTPAVFRSATTGGFKLRDLS